MKHTFARGSRYNFTRVIYNTLTHDFQVPLDYANPQGDELAIALLKIPANISTSDPAYRGPILMNGGGAGVSGVDSAMDFGPILHSISGFEFDIIGFDPRGE